MTAIPEFPAATPDRDHEVAKESLRQRCLASGSALPSMAIAVVSIVAMLDGAVERTWLLAWAASMLVLTLVRARVCRGVLKALDEADRDAVGRMEPWMFSTLAANTLAAGSMIWLPGLDQAAEARLLVTLLACFYAIGSLVNSSSHFASYAAGVSLNLGQLILFWVLQGHDGPKIALLLAIIGYLLAVAGRYNARTFRTSFLARFENQELLQQVVAEKQEAEAARRVAEKASQSKSRFLAAASHDLRQPLHALSLYSGALDLQVTDAAARTTVGKLQATIEALDHTFEGLLDLSALDAQNLVPRIDTVAVRGLFTQLGDEFQPQAQAKGLVLEVEAPSVRMLTDEVLIGRVLRNLLTNAVRYSSAGRVLLAARVDGDRVVITVSDQGPGIAAEDQDRIFDEFDQLDNPGRDRRKGFGLGLAVVRRIDRLLGLRLALMSSPGAGASFTLSVPVAAGDPAPPPVVAGAGSSGSSASSASSGSLGPLGSRPTGSEAIAGIRVVAIDDDPVVCDALRAQLTEWGVEVLPFSLGEAQIDALVADPPANAVFVVDDMLGMRRSGLQIALALADRVDRRRIVLMTGNTQGGRLAEIAAAGVSVLGKPVLPRELLACLTGIDRTQ